MTAKIKLNAASGGGSVSIVAPTSTTSNANVELKLPIADGSSEQVIKTDGSGNLSFGQAVTARNLVINGAMNVAQKSEDYLGAQSSSTSTGHQTVDRFQVLWAGAGSAGSLTQEQSDVSSGTTPYTLGFRKALKATNGTDGSVAATDYAHLFTKLEAQDIAQSGWNYTDPNSFITLSFYVKSSVAQNFYGYIKTYDATYQYPFETGALTANTWTKVTKTIPGNSNLVFNNDNGQGMLVLLNPFLGTNYTDSGVSLNTWVSTNDAARTPDFATTWWTTNNATFEMTGVQLEVGSSASAFAHESYTETLKKCQRYLYKITIGINSVYQFKTFHRFSGSGGHAYHAIDFPTEMRADPSFIQDGTTYSASGYTGDVVLQDSFRNSASLKSSVSNVAANASVYLRPNNTSGSYLNLLFSAEL